MHNRNKKITLLLLLVVTVSAFLVYSPSLTSEFVWDDLHYKTNPAMIGSNPYSFFLGSSVYYRPLLHLSVVFDYSIWHLNPFGYHLTNILLHTICSILVFLAGLLIFNTKSTKPFIKTEPITSKHPAVLSFMAAMLFVFHPIHTESVAWINGRTDIMATLFILLAFISFLSYLKNRTSALVLCSLFFLFALFCKENAVSLIGIVLIYGIITGIPKRKIFLTELSLFAGFAVYLALRSGGGIKELTAAPGTREAFFASAVTLSKFFNLISMGIGFYFKKLVLPVDLNIFPSLPENPIYYVIFFTPLIIGCFLYIKGKRLAVFLTMWIIITLMPSLLILFSQVAYPVAERYLYMPSVGFVILLSMLIGKIKDRRLVFILLCSILAFYSVITLDRLVDWKNDAALWEDTAMKNPDSPVAHTNYAAALIRAGDPDRAREELLIAVKQKDISFTQTSKILELLGLVETKSGNYEKAEEYLVNSIKANNKNTSAYNNLGFLYASMAETTDDARKKTLHRQAIEKYEIAVMLSPSFIQPKYNIGLSYMKMGEFEKALEYFSSVIKSDPEGEMSQKAVTFIAFIKELKEREIKGI
jgi:tetratricopeptide (TPR) repeat protein